MCNVQCHVHVHVCVFPGVHEPSMHTYTCTYTYTLYVDNCCSVHIIVVTCNVYMCAFLTVSYASVLYTFFPCICSMHMFIFVCRFGPLINHWTTRFEAKHKYFKHLANVLGNFTNICYSLALRHQFHQCYLMLNSHTLSGEKIEIGPGTLGN